jgi:mono/diheme cytochrome c family protein
MMRDMGIRAAALATTILAAQLFTGSARAADADILARGKYLLNAGDCVSCHSAPGGQPLAGGLQVKTPFGPMVTPNITPDKETGIGNYTDDQFYRTMHEGIGPGGEYLYPVFPFPWYTKVTREDALAIKAYLFSLPPVHAKQDVNQLSFPFNIRTSLLGWRQIFFKEGNFQPDPAKSEQVNRGAYLVEGLGHCAECHTPHNAVGGTENSKAYEGAVIDGWFAPNISSDMVEGIGSWSQDQLVSYLKTGLAPGKGIVAGPMSEVVHESLGKLTDADVTAIAVYLKQLPPKQSYTPQPATGAATNAPQAVAYATFCASCHQQNGGGVSGVIPNLNGNGSVVASGPGNVLKVIVGGLGASGDYAAMPAIGVGMTDQQIADATNFVRSAWSNKAPENAEAGAAGTARASTDTMLSGGACDPADPKIIAPSADIAALLGDVNESNMLQQVNALVGKVKSGSPRADVVNTLTAMYCPVVAKTPGVTRPEKAVALGRFAQLVYTALVQPGGKD